jgi:hypothetical protein
MKVAPVWRALDALDRFHLTLVHTGQHYDDNMSKIFFDDLKLPRPDVHMGVGSGSHAEQTAKVMLAFEPVMKDADPDLVVVVGDVNSTMACTLVSVKLDVPVAHVEAGLRSFDRKMPEEINRMVTDILCDLLFTTSRDADDNLRREGVDPNKIHRRRGKVENPADPGPREGVLWAGHPPPALQRGRRPPAGPPGRGFDPDRGRLPPPVPGPPPDPARPGAGRNRGSGRPYAANRPHWVPGLHAPDDV